MRAGADEGTQPELPGTSRARGRKNADGSAEVIKIAPIKQGMAECMKLLRRAQDAATKSNEAFEALAERSGVKVGPLKKLFKSSLKGNYADVRREIDQAQVLFEQVGEIPGGGTGASGE